uniref:Uncharacterized protein n=1 Tax=Alexandrium monilatum TaxID=311494 RepID=A0A7S4QT06_9DINO
MLLRNGTSKLASAAAGRFLVAARRRPLAAAASPFAARTMPLWRGARCLFGGVSFESASTPARVRLAQCGGGVSPERSDRCDDRRGVASGPSPRAPRGLSPRRCREGTNAVVRPPTSSKATSVPFGRATPGPLGPTFQRTWKSQSFGNRAASASTATALRSTASTAECTAAACTSLSDRPGAAGCTPAAWSASSATQLPTPQTAFSWSSRTAFTGAADACRAAAKAASGKGEARGSGASRDTGDSSNGALRRSTCPNRRGSVKASFVVLPLPFPQPPVNSNCSLLKRGGQARQARLSLVPGFVDLEALKAEALHTVHHQRSSHPTVKHQVGAAAIQFQPEVLSPTLGHHDRTG